MLLLNEEVSFEVLPTLPVDGTGSPPLLAPRWPLVPVLPTPVVDGQRWCVGASYESAVEYAGVGGVWVAQASKTYGVWVWKGVFRNAGSDYVNCGRPTLVNKLRPQIDEFTIVSKIKMATNASAGFIVAMHLNNAEGSQLAQIHYENNSPLVSRAGGTDASSTSGYVINQMIEVRSCVKTGTQYLWCNGGVIASSSVGSVISTANLTIGGSNGGADNFEGDVCCIEFYEGANADGSLTGLTLIDRYDFDKWDGSANGVSQNGFPFTVSDGVPFTAKSYAWVPA